MAVTLETIAKWLDEEGIKYEKVNDRLRVVYETDCWESLALHCYLSEDGKWLIIYTEFDSITDDSSEEQNRKMTGLLQLNYRLPGVKFQMDDELGIGLSTEYDTVSVSKDELITGINTLLEAADALDKEVLSPEEVVSEALKELEEAISEEEVPPPPEPTCETCDQPLTWIAQYKRWYCKKCGKYGSATLPPP